MGETDLHRAIMYCTAERLKGFGVTDYGDLIASQEARNELKCAMSFPEGVELLAARETLGRTVEFCVSHDRLPISRRG